MSEIAQIIKVIKRNIIINIVAIVIQLSVVITLLMLINLIKLSNPEITYSLKWVILILTLLGGFITGNILLKLIYVIITPILIRKISYFGLIHNKTWKLFCRVAGNTSMLLDIKTIEINYLNDEINRLDIVIKDKLNKKTK